MTVRLDHYVGYLVADVLRPDEQGTAYALEMGDGSLIRCYDEESEISDVAKGNSILQVREGDPTEIDFGATPDNAPAVVVWTSAIRSGMYGISVPDSDEIVYPDEPVEDDLPPDPSPDRTQEGPQEPSDAPESPSEPS